MKYRLLLDPTRLKGKTQTGYKTADNKTIWKEFLLTDDRGLSHYPPYAYIYGAYDLNPDLQSLYSTYTIDNHKHIFKPIDR